MGGARQGGGRLPHAGKVNEDSVSSRAADKAAHQMSEALAREEGRVELRKLFRQLDTDGDGRISSEEWARGMGKQGTAMAKYFGGSTYEDLARAFARIDTDGDGYITLDEMVEGAAQHQRTVESRSVPPGKIVEGLLAARGA